MNILEYALKTTVEAAGGVYVGIQRSQYNNYVVYNDPITGTTLMIDVKFSNKERIRRKMLLSRIKFMK